MVTHITRLTVLRYVLARRQRHSDSQRTVSFRSNCRGTGRHWWHWLLTAVVLLNSAARLQAETPPWADPALPVQTGLSLWLDAARINAAHRAAGTAELPANAAVSAWPDSSGRDRHLTQSDAAAQPQLIRTGDAWTVRFDGDNDHLRCLQFGQQLQQATVFLMTAPHQNPGDFRGLLAGNAAEQRDYESGLTIDLGPGPTRQLEQLNVEGRGFGGAQDLLEQQQPFGTLHLLETVLNGDNGTVSLLLDGQPSGSRPWMATALLLDQLTLGARFYTNGPGAQQVRGPFRGDIAEVLIYDRVLSADESAAVRAYLTSKYARLAEELPGQLQLTSTAGVPLVKADNPPQVQLLLPGFSVRELPLQLTNVNNVRYRHDGRLVTLGYNGDIHLLADTDGDGLEDQATLFWKNNGSLRGPIGLQLTPPGYARGNGVFVPSKGKVSLIVDTDGDDRADEEIIVAQGWKEIFTTVDALGIAMDRDGQIYFGLGVANFADAYQIGEDGTARYDRHADNGTIQKVSADFQHRETVCTGIRFPVALAFNRQGDLFCTEQEGATWLPNGNPLDELLHIRTGRHYGFPPRHPRHNPDVIDEPSTFNYGPQHQSTCGMVFNESVNGGPVFGPAAWAGDAIVCGESRGKLWRTRLVPTPSGYTAASQLLACLQMLTVDACVAPDGDLLVACHSGPPDWGTGPTGIGRLFRIQMDQPDVPRPLAAWAEGPQEIRIAFDHPLDPLSLRQLAEQVRVEYGDHVRAGDRFENLMPPYAVVQAQLLQPRFVLPVATASVTNDLRTLIIHSAAPMPSAVHYAVTLPSASAAASHAADSSAAAAVPADLRQHPQMDVDFSLTGLQAEWKPEQGTADNGTAAAATAAGGWSGWLPHGDLSVCQALLQGSAGHEALWNSLNADGMLILRTRLNLHNILRPAVQPGATLDYEWPPETAILSIASSHDFVIRATQTAARSEAAADSANGTAADSAAPVDIPVVCDQSDPDRQTARLTVSADALEPIDLEIAVRTGQGTIPRLEWSLQTNEDASLRPVSLERFLLPWVQSQQPPTATAAPRQIAELAGGSWARGRQVFHSEAAGCFKCHSVGGGGARIGPDLMNLVHRDYTSVLRDITQPGFAINPDYIGHVIALKDGRLLTGVLQTEGDQLLLGDDKGQVIPLSRDEIESMVPARTSIMPTGIAEKLTAEQRRDLLTYLLTPPPQMPLDSPLTAPPLRTRAEVLNVLRGAPAQTTPARPLNIVLTAGPKDHGPGEHDYPAWQQAWEELLLAAAGVEVSTAWEFPDDQQLASADVVLFFQKGSWGSERAAQIDAFLARGGGLVYIHWAVNGNDQVQDFSRRIGLASWGGRIRFRHGPLTLDMHNTDHPILRNFERLQLYDESYWLLTGNPEDVTLLGTSTEDGQPTPQLWVKEQGRGRVFVSIPGHYSWTFDDPLFRVLLLRGVAWSAHEPVDRFNELVWPGARVSR